MLSSSHGKDGFSKKCIFVEVTVNSLQKKINLSCKKEVIM